MFWKTFTVDKGEIYYTRIGPLELWIKQYLNDWYISSKRESTEDGYIPLHKPETVPDDQDLSWNRWVLSTGSNIISFKPIMPDRAIIIRPQIPIKIPCNNAGKFYVNIQVWIRIEIGEKDTVTLLELPVLTLSKSWFGNTYSGELCYSKKSLVRREFNELEDNPCSAICSVKIKNKSKLELNFERFCLNVENLSVFSDTDRLCTNHVDVVFRGEEQESQITISKTHSNFLKNCKLLNKPRREIDKNIIKLSYQFFKTFTGI